MQLISLQLNGPNATEVATILAARLAYFQCTPELDQNRLRIATPATNAPQNLAVDLDPHDTPDFAAEKVIDILAENKVISLPSTDYTREEEETIRRRLQDLGYIE